MFSHQIGRRRDRITLNGTEFSDGTGQRERLASFKTNPAGAAIVTTIAELRAMISPDPNATGRRYLVVMENDNGLIGQIVQVQRLTA
ncbi:MAG: hypothetical protein WA304_05910 [Candidatus Cybelea sp.]